VGDIGEARTRKEWTLKEEVDTKEVVTRSGLCTSKEGSFEREVEKKRTEKEVHECCLGFRSFQTQTEFQKHFRKTFQKTLNYPTRGICRCGCWGCSTALAILFVNRTL